MVLRGENPTEKIGKEFRTLGARFLVSAVDHIGDKREQLVHAFTHLQGAIASGNKVAFDENFTAFRGIVEQAPINENQELLELGRKVVKLAGDF